MVNKIIISFLISLLLINCRSLSNENKKEYTNIYTNKENNNYKIYQIYDKGILSLYKDDTTDKVVYRVYKGFNNDNKILAMVSGIPPYVCIDVEKQKIYIDSVTYSSKVKLESAHYPKAMEQYYNEVLVENLSEPMNEEEKKTYEWIYKDLSEEERKKKIDGGFKKKEVYAEIQMPDEILKIKYVQGKYPAFFGTDELYKKGILFFYTGNASNVESLEKYSSLYIIKPKELTDSITP